MDYISTGKLIQMAKTDLGICASNAEMTDREVIDAIIFASKIVYGHLDMILVLILSAAEFPTVCSRHYLWEPN